MRLTFRQYIDDDVITSTSYDFQGDTTVMISDEYEVSSANHVIHLDFSNQGTPSGANLPDISHYNDLLYKPTGVYDELIGELVQLPHQIYFIDDGGDKSIEIYFERYTENHSVYLNRYNVITSQNQYIDRITLFTGRRSGSIVFTLLADNKISYKVDSYDTVTLTYPQENEITSVEIDNHALEINTPYTVTYDVNNFDLNLTLKYVISETTRYVYVETFTQTSVMDEFKSKKIKTVYCYIQNSRYFARVTYDDDSFKTQELVYRFDIRTTLDVNAPITLKYGNNTAEMHFGDTHTFLRALDMNLTISPSYYVSYPSIRLYFSGTLYDESTFSLIDYFRINESEVESGRMVTLYYHNTDGTDGILSAIFTVPDGKVFRGLKMNNQQLYAQLDADINVRITDNVNFSIIYDDQDTPITSGGLLRGDINERYWLMNLSELNKVLAKIKYSDDSNGNRYNSLKYLKAIGYYGIPQIFYRPTPENKNLIHRFIPDSPVAIDVDFGTDAWEVVSNDLQLYINDFQIPMYYGDFRDHSPYTIYKLYLPFLEEITIDDAYVHSRLSVFARFNLDSATLTYVIRADGKNIGTYRCNPSIDIDYRYSTKNTFDEIRTLTNSVLSVFGGLKAISYGQSQGILNVGGGVLNAMEYAMRDKTNMVDDIEGGDNLLRDLTPKIIVFRTNADFHSNINGRVLEEMRTLNTLNGFTIINKPRLNIPVATLQEVDEIKALMQNGIII